MAWKVVIEWRYDVSPFRGVELLDDKLASQRWNLGLNVRATWQS